jgi:HEAT repeat protein
MNLRSMRGLLCLALLLSSTAPSTAEEEAAEGLVGVVVELLHDKDKDIRALALEQIRTEAPGAAATKVFARELVKLPAAAQVGLLRALAARGDIAAKPAVLACLTSEDAAVKVAALEALGALGDASDTALLVQRLASDSPEEQTAARGSLVRLRGEQVSSLIAADLPAAAAPLRVTLIEILAARRGTEAVPALLDQAQNADATIRIAAMQALGQLASVEQLPGLIAGVLAAEPGKERDAAEKCVAAVCSTIEDANRRDAPLLAILAQHSPADREKLLPLLGRVGGTGALNAIEKAIADKNPALHERGVRALCNWPNASMAPQLMELAATDKNEALRIAALRAAIRIAPLADDRSDEQRIALLKKALQMATRDEERLLALDRARTIRSLAALHLVMPYLDRPKFAERACTSIVELAHHRTLRQPNKAEFDAILDKVIATSHDPVVIDRAKRYQKDQTWVRPKK